MKTQNYIQNVHIIKVKYLGATNTKGSRVKLTSEHFDESITFPFDYEKNSTNDMAIDWLQAHGHRVIAQAKDAIVCEAVDGMFKPLK